MKEYQLKMALEWCTDQINLLGCDRNRLL